LREQITALEAALVSSGAPAGASRRSEGPRVLTTEELAAIRDDLVSRLEQLDQMRDDLVEVLGSIRAAIGEDQPVHESGRRAADATARRRPRPATG
jgi:hypothetical protein